MATHQPGVRQKLRGSGTAAGVMMQEAEEQERGLGKHEGEVVWKDTQARISEGHSSLHTCRQLQLASTQLRLASTQLRLASTQLQLASTQLCSAVSTALTTQHLAAVYSNSTYNRATEIHHNSSYNQAIKGHHNKPHFILSTDIAPFHATNMGHTMGWRQNAMPCCHLLMSHVLMSCLSSLLSSLLFLTPFLTPFPHSFSSFLSSFLSSFISCGHSVVTSQCQCCSKRHADASQS
jgi:hypothetical protein